MRLKNDNIFVLVVLGCALFVFGWFLSSRKKNIEAKAGEIAVQQGIDYIKSEANVTKDWFNQLKNTIKQAWK